jgi:hypothetical protein
MFWVFSFLGPKIQTAHQAMQVRKGFGHVHLIDAMDGSLCRYFTCFRCRRRMPDSSFVCVGTKTYGQKTVTALHPKCHSCRKQEKGRWVEHPNYTPKLDRYWAAKMPKIRAGANPRSIMFAIESDDLLGMYLEQGGRCALTGLPFDLYGTSKKYMSGKNAAAPSVDRIDSSKHYTVDNIQIVLLAVNIMKGELPQDVFLEFCRQIVINKMLA